LTDNSFDFAFIAGHEPAPPGSKPTAQVGSELEVLMEAVAVMVNWRRRRQGAFHCLAFRQNGDRVKKFELQVWPDTQSYRAVDAESGVVDSYNSETGEYVSHNERRALGANEFMTEPLAARLAFPLHLPIWGHPRDGYRMIGASRVGNEIVVRLQHQGDPNLFGSMTIDSGRGVVTRFDTPTETCWYENVEPSFDRL
jgi:hypothetical protein